MPPICTEAGEGLTEIETRWAVVPLPLRAIFCGLLLALSRKLKVAERVPATLGWKVTDAVQLAPAASVAGLRGQVEVTEKSLRLVAMVVIDSGVGRLFVSVAVCGGLEVPTVWVLKVRLEGLTTAARTPVPVRLTVGLEFALSVIVRVPFRAPVASGAKTTETLQLAPAASVLGLTGHVVVSV